MKPPATISPASGPPDITAVAQLFAAYAASLGVDLGYQDFETELASLPGKYAPPSGALLLARDATRMPVGCVALRPLADAGACEMKRLYVAPEGRGLGLGKALLAAIIGEARRIGYREIRLDALPTMTAAQALYRAHGFEPMAPYYDTPVAGTAFLQLRLS
ncbi:GNAT family N-acetyltransferase [Nannocystis radixulma]|uniref:GNAT family N-acetyltransferase n=1 Tax=Nannocystis radixulma TaxID=2995305 RepID=A0ABT5B079_9BACT|nr:GNAT family N-acetyltransferase [Nannocystis radixulma]MDC0667143.1 GNAT family N-acetyltransferase [Nannocystis radixulma]